MRSNFLCILCAALALSACASTSSTPSTPPTVPVNFVGCSSVLRAPAIPDGGNGDAILILLALEAGFDIAAYSTCTVERLVHSNVTGTVTGDIYRSAQHTFSFALPVPPADVRQPGIDVVQFTVIPSESVVIRPMDDGEAFKSGAVAFGATISHETALEQSATLEQAGLEELQRQAGTTSATLVHHEPAMLDGRPALFAIYRVKLTGADSDSQLHYLFTYFTRTQHDSAALVVFWSGDCAACAAGHEADISQLDPNIGRVVDSFHLDESAVLAWDGTNSPPAGNPAPPALPRMTIPPGKAVIYFYRESQFAGGGLNFHIAEDSASGTLTNGTYFPAVVEPGPHTFTMSTWGSDDDPCSLQINSGETRYVEVYVSRIAVLGSSLVLSCRESQELETRLKMADLKESTKD